MTDEIRGVTLRITNGGLTNALLQLAKDQQMEGSDNIDASKWNATVDKLVEIQEKHKTEGKAPIFSGGTKKNNWHKNMIVHSGQEIEFTKEEMTELYAAMGVSFKQQKPEADNDGNQGGSPEAPAAEDNGTAQGEKYAAFVDKKLKAGSSAFADNFEVMSDEWLELANKKNRSPEETKRMQEEYTEKFSQLGKSYMLHLDKKYGNGDGVLTREEYVQSELEALPENERTNEAKTSANNIANNLDINQDGNIDEQEMAASLSMFDMDNNTGRMDGKINVRDITFNALNLAKPANETKISERLKMIFNILFGKKA